MHGATTTPIGPARPIRVLTLDGGPAALLTVDMLSQIEEQVPGFLAKVDIFAGTSSGGINSLIFAAATDPATRLEVAANFWRNPGMYYKNSLFGMMKATYGLGAFNNSKYVQRFLAQDGVLGDLKLGQLAHGAMVTSLDLSPEPTEHRPNPTWSHRFFRNFGADVKDLEMSAVDAALCTSASPIVTPVHLAKVDGGLVANNPAVCALAELARHGFEGEEVALDRVLMLSVGGGRAAERLKADNNNWGYLHWLLNISNPLLLVNAFLSGSTDAAVFQARHLGGRGQVWRLDPFYEHGGILPFVQITPKALEKTATEPNTLRAVRNAVEWIKRTTWMND